MLSYGNEAPYAPAGLGAGDAPCCAVDWLGTHPAMNLQAAV